LDSDKDVYVTINEKRTLATTLIGNASTSSFESIPFKLAVTMGLYPKFSWVDKFGANKNISPGTVPETLWEFGGVYPWGNDAGEPIYISSSNPADNQIVEILAYKLIGSDWVTETIPFQVQGQTKTQVIIPGGYDIVRAHRCESAADAGGDIQGTVYVYYDTTVTGGIPDDLTKVLTGIVNGANQSKQLTYTVPSGYVAFLFRGEAGVTRSQGTDECDFAYVSRREGKVFKEKKDFGVMTTGSNFYVDERTFPDPIPEKTDLGINVLNVSGNNMGAWGTFDILIIEKDFFSEAYLNALGMSLVA